MFLMMTLHLRTLNMIHQKRRQLVTTKRQIAWMDSPLAGDVGASTIGKHFLKRSNVDFLLGEFDILITIPNEDTSYLSEGVHTEAT